MVEAFKLSILAVATLLPLQLYGFFTLGGAELGFGGKELGRGNRFGFIYLMAIWLTYFLPRQETDGMPHQISYSQHTFRRIVF